MKKFLLHISFLALLCMVLANCRHDPDPEPEFCEYDSSVEEMKKWYYFKTGTWWVYQEQTTGDLDTVTVFDNSAGVSGGFDFFNYYVHHSHDGFDVNYYFNSSFSIHCLTETKCTCHKVLRSRYEPGNFVGEGWIFLYPLIEGNYTASNGGWCTLDTMHSAYSVNSIIYSNVSQWDIPNDDSEDDVHTKYWIGKNFGIVRRKNLSTNMDWILIESIIIQ